MRDVGERAAMHEGGRAFQRLHQIGRQSVLQQHRHGAVCLQVLRRHRRAIALLRHDHAPQALLQIVQIARQAEHRHHLGSDGDVEPVLAREAVGHTAQAAHDAAQRAIVHVEAAPPGDAPRVDAQRIAPVDVVVDHRGQQVVGRGDGVEVAGEMQVDLVHRHDLRIAAAGGAALHAEARPERGFAQADHRARADAVQRIAETDGGSGLALACRRRADAGHQHQRAVRPVLQRLDEVDVDLRLVPAIRLQRIGGDVQFRGDLRDRAQLGLAGDLQVAFHALVSSAYLAHHGVRPVGGVRRILGAQSPISDARNQAGLSITSAASISYSAR